MGKKEIVLAALIVAISIIASLINPKFLSYVNLINMANLVGLFGIFSLGVGLVIITGNIELSVGSMFALLGVIFVNLLVDYHFPWPAAFAVVILLGGLLGGIHGFLVARVKLQAFVVTLCGLLIYRGAARYIANDEIKGFGYSDKFDFLSNALTAKLFGLPASFVIMVVFAGIVGLFVHRSIYGRYLFAVGKSERAARYSGINSNLVVISVFVVCGLLSGIASIEIMFYTQSISPTSHGNFYELYAIAAAVLGGCSLRGGEGSVLGIILGTILLQVLQNLVNILGIPSSLNFAVMGGVILIGVLLDEYVSHRKAIASVKIAHDKSAVPNPAEG